VYFSFWPWQICKKDVDCGNNGKCIYLNYSDLDYGKGKMCTCGSTEFNEIEVSGEGKIVSFTQIHSDPEAFS
jgi:hypothetical protein